MSNIDVCVHPSLDEAFGISLLEAMAGSKPVVATRVGGISEIVRDGATGILVPPRDSSAIAAAVRALLSDKELSRQMGIAGRARVEQEFTIQKTVRAYENLYGAIAGYTVSTSAV